MHVIRKAADLGAVAANGVEVVGFLKDRDRVAGVRTRDFDIAAARVVNATGVWCDEVRGEGRTIRPSKGAHLVVPAKRLALTCAAMLPSAADGRIVFLIPWGDRAIVGTTDTDYAGSLDRPRAEAEDIEYLLALVNASLPGVGLARNDILSTYAGLRPLLRDDAEAPSSLSREHHLFEDASGLMTITGGKLTTYRLMAREVVNRLTRRKCRTQEIDLFATEGRDALSRRYGSEAARIGDRTPIVDGLPYVWGEVDHAMEREMARGLTDVLSRRTRLALFAEDRGRSIAGAVARRMAARLGWDAKEVGRQLDAYERALEEEFPRP